MKTLIAYYSRGGNTAKAAKRLQTLIGGDLFEIKGKKNYGNYFQALGVARKEFNNSELPEVTEDVKNFSSYDRILIGFPIWYSKAPQLVVSFMAVHDFNGKDVYPFCTSGMSGPDGAQEQFRKNCEGARIHKGLRISNSVDDGAVKNWIDAPASN